MSSDWMLETLEFDPHTVMTPGVMAPVPEILARTPPFNVMNVKEREAFLKLEPPVLCYETNQVIIRKGERHRILYLLLHGSLLVTRPEMSAPLARLEAGSFFGEMSFLNPSPRHTDVVAESRCFVMKMDREFFDDIPFSTRDAIKDHLISLLVKRLDTMNEALSRIARFARGRITY